MLVVLVHNLSYISIHAPARGATAARSCPAAVVLFQSTPPRGGRQNHCKGRRAPRHISIHAPARGATIVAKPEFSPFKFQSTPPRGGRQDGRWVSICNRRFQSTPPRGGRHTGRALCNADIGFQSTPPRGGRLQRVLHRRTAGHFNPRPREGGDVTHPPCRGSS